MIRSSPGKLRKPGVGQVIDGGYSVPTVSRSREMSGITLENWVARARKGEPAIQLSARPPVNER